jgi:hypothetical protein
MDRMGLIPAGKVSREWFTRGSWLAEAWQAFGQPNYLSAVCAAAERFAKLRHGETPNAYLICSDQSHSGLSRPEQYRELRKRLGGAERQAWVDYYTHRAFAEQEVLDRLTFGTLLAFGAPHNPAAEIEWIPPQAWYYLRLDPAHNNVVQGVNIAYWHVQVVDLAKSDANDQAALLAPTTPVVKQRYSPEALGAWFILRVHSWPPESALPSEEVDRIAAEAVFDSVPRGEFREIRAGKTPPNWRKPGPRRGR